MRHVTYPQPEPLCVNRFEATPPRRKKSCRSRTASTSTGLTLPPFARVWTLVGVAGRSEGWKAGGLRCRKRVQRGGTGRASCSVARGKPRRRPLELLASTAVRGGACEQDSSTPRMYSSEEFFFLSFRVFSFCFCDTRRECSYFSSHSIFGVQLFILSHGRRECSCLSSHVFLRGTSQRVESWAPAEATLFVWGIARAHGASRLNLKARSRHRGGDIASSNTSGLAASCSAFDRSNSIKKNVPAGVTRHSPPPGTHGHALLVPLSVAVPAGRI